ncbi:MAG TPA: TIGR03118 family protein [Pirellulales bacterium]
MRSWRRPLTGRATAKRGYARRARRARQATLETLETRRVLATGYLQLNLVADQANTALVQDANLVNPAGVALNANGGDLFVADRASGVASLYLGAVNGSAFQVDSSTISIPGGGPDGVVINGTPGFVIHAGAASGPASVLFASAAGAITGWNQGVPPPAPSGQAQTAVTTPNAVYTGLALANNGTQNLLYAADFHDNRIDVFDSGFNAVTTSGGFSDPNLPASFAPYNVANLSGHLFVSYAQQDANRQNPVAQPGAGIVDVYDYNGVLLKRLVSGGGFSGPLNVPWGLAIAPAGFGDFSGDLLVANQGDGTIHAFDPNSGILQGVLATPTGQPLVIDGVHALQFGNGLTAGSGNTLFITSGPSGGQHGVLSELQSAQGMALTAQGTAVSATVGTAFSGTLAVFAEAFNVSPAGVTVNIDWGDGATSAGAVSALARGGYAVSGTHVYLASGLKSISIHVTDPMNHSATANSLVRVAQPGVVANGITFTPTEGNAFSGTVATFTDGDGNTSPASYSATINWGDGNTTAGAIAAAGSGFIVQGQHTYAGAATHGVTVSISDTDGDSATTTSTARVADAPLTGANRTISLTEQTAFSGVVASFTDANPAADPGDFAATINWGDGATTTGDVTASAGVFSVSGSHTYADEEATAITVVVNDAGGSTATIVSVVSLADADTLVATAVPAAATEGVTFRGALTTFTDTLIVASADDFASTIDWGDGTTTTGSVSGAAGVFTLHGSHAYADEGTYTLTASVNDVGGTASATAQQVVAVIEHDVLSITPTEFSPTEGVAFNGAVATVSDSDSNAAADFTALIDWGDGTTTTGSVSGTGGLFTLGGSHTYAEEGTYTPVVSIVDDPPGTASATATMSTVVADAPLSGSPVTLNLTEGAAFAGAVAAISDANPNGSINELSATIDWGDGATASGTIVSGSGGLEVMGSHTYSEGGTYHPQVTITDIGGASVVVVDSALVADYPLTASGATITLQERSAATTTVATFTDADPDGGAAGEYTATIDWGDGTTTFGAVSGSSGAYQVSGAHAYADEARQYVMVIVRDAGGSSATAASLAIVTEAQLSDGTRGTPDTRWVNEIYGDLLGRAAEPGALRFWGNQLAAGDSRAQVALAIEATAEYRGDEVNHLYVHYLHRPTDPGALSFGTTFLASGKTIEQLATIVAGSSEYFTRRGGGTNDGFLNALFQDALARSVDSGARQYFDGLLAGGTPRSQVAAAIFASDEYLGDVVAGVYLEFLQRPVDAAAHSFWIAQLSHGVTDQQLLAAVCASGEYFSKTAP